MILPIYIQFYPMLTINRMFCYITHIRYKLLVLLKLEIAMFVLYYVFNVIFLGMPII